MARIVQIWRILREACYSGEYVVDMTVVDRGLAKLTI